MLKGRKNLQSKNIGKKQVSYSNNSNKFMTAKTCRNIAQRLKRTKAKSDTNATAIQKSVTNRKIKVSNRKVPEVMTLEEHLNAINIESENSKENADQLVK